MITRALLLSAVCLMAAARTVEAAVKTDFWDLDAALPSEPRVVKRVLKASDPEAAAAGVAVWMEENHAKLLNPGGPEGGSIHDWALPPAMLPELDSMLAQYGKIHRRAYLPSIQQNSRIGKPSAYSPDMRPMVDPELVVAKRDALLQEVDAMTPRVARIPNIVFLASSFAESLDRIAEARERYDATVVVDLEISDAASGAEPRVAANENTQFNRFTSMRYLPPSYGQAPGFARIPSKQDREPDFLTWNAVTVPLEDLCAYLIGVETEGGVRNAAALDALLLSAGAKPAIMPARALSTHEQVQAGVIYEVSPPKGYLIPAADEQKFRILLSSRTGAFGWSANHNRWDQSYTDAGEWGRTLAAEVEGEKDRLAQFPNAKALAASEIRRLKVFADSTPPSPPALLLAVEVVEKLANSRNLHPQIEVREAGATLPPPKPPPALPFGQSQPSP